MCARPRQVGGVSYKVSLKRLYGQTPNGLNISIAITIAIILIRPSLDPLILPSWSSVSLFISSPPSTLSPVCIDREEFLVREGSRMCLRPRMDLERAP